MQIGNSFNTQTTNNINQNKTSAEEALSKIAATRELSGKDGANYLVANELASQISTLTQSIQNENDKVGMYQIAGSSINSLYENADRLNELSVNYNNPILSASQKNSLQEEFKNIQDAMQQSIDTTSYNGMSLFSSANNLEVSGLEQMSIENQDSIATFMQGLDTLNSQVGSSINRSEVSIANSLSALSNTTSSYAVTSESPMDTKVNDFSASQIKLQSSLMVQAHQNEIAQQRVAALLV